MRPKQVIMKPRYLDAMLDQLRHHGRDFFLQQNEIAHYHGFRTHGLESDPATKSERRFYSNAIQRYVEVSAREAVPMHVAGGHGCLSAEGFIDLSPVDLLAIGR